MVVFKTNPASSSAFRFLTLGFVVLVFAITGCGNVKVSEPDEVRVFGKPIKDMFTAKCVSVSDGDTIVVEQPDGKQLTINLDSIDCPENSQPYADEATQFVKDKVLGRQVVIQTTGPIQQQQANAFVSMITDQTIGEPVLIDDHSMADFETRCTSILNVELLKSGLAWHHKEYSSDHELASFELQASTNKQGLWSAEDSVPPWVWEMKDSNLYGPDHHPDSLPGDLMDGPPDFDQF